MTGEGKAVAALPKTAVNFAIWRIVLEGIATLQEIETHWSIDDLADAHEALDLKTSLETAARARARGKGSA